MADDALPTMAEELASVVPVAASVAPTVVDAEELADIEDFGPRLSLKDVRQLRMLRAFIRTGRVGDACKAAGIKYGAFYRWKEDDRDFLLAFERAKDMLVEDLEETGMQRAKDGSDALLQFFLKSLNPSKYREKQIITIVSPDVQSRLARQADSILEVCRLEISDTDLRAKVTASIANRLREVWAE